MQVHCHSQLPFENNSKQFVYLLVHLFHLVNIIDLIRPIYNFILIFIVHNIIYLTVI